MSGAILSLLGRGGRRSVRFAFYRSGTSRGAFLMEKDVPAKGPERDAFLCKLMGSGHPQQLEGFGGGTGPTSKAVLVGPHPEPNSVTYTFSQCRVKEASVDHSHGDCGNMLAAVAPFALEMGLVKVSSEKPTTKVHIHSLNTGAVYSADVLTNPAGPPVVYDGDLHIVGTPNPASPVVITTHGIAGAQTGRLLPTGRNIEEFDLGSDLGKVPVTVVDFARALAVVDAGALLPRFGYNNLAQLTKPIVDADVNLNAALERVRLAVSLASGMGDCSNKDAPKVAVVGPCEEDTEGRLSISCRYWVNPGRNEMHPAIAMTAAQAIGAACFLPGSVIRNNLPSPLGFGEREVQLAISLSAGAFPVKIMASTDTDPTFPDGIPEAASYTTTVRPIADGHAFI